MDFEQNDYSPGPSAPQPQPLPRPPRKGGIGRIFWRIVLALSIMTNIVLVFLLFGAAAFMVLGSGGLLTEEVVRNRMKVYSEQTAPVVDYYAQKGLLSRVLGEGSIDEVFQRLKGVLQMGSTS